MSIGCQVSEKYANRLATARMDRAAEVQASADWLDRLAMQFRLAMTSRIPMGFEDEAGFHFGAEPAEAPRRQAPEAKTISTNSYPI
jgi:hypothetical protein